MMEKKKVKNPKQSFATREGQKGPFAREGQREAFAPREGQKGPFAREGQREAFAPREGQRKAFAPREGQKGPFAREGQREAFAPLPPYTPRKKEGPLSSSKESARSFPQRKEGPLLLASRAPSERARSFPQRKEGPLGQGSPTKGQRGAKKNKYRRKKPKGIIYIQCTRINTIVTLTDLRGNAKHYASGGSCGFKGARRKTPYAAQAAAQEVAKKALLSGYPRVKVLMKGKIGKKKSAVRALSLSGLKITQIQDRSNKPHNGCRVSKRRRIKKKKK